MGIFRTRSSHRKSRSRQMRKKYARSGRKTSPYQKNQHTNVSIPPVMVRGLDGGAALGSRRSYNRSRRRIDVPLHTPGAEVRLPSIPQISIGWRILSLVLVLACAYIFYSLWNSDTYRVGLVEISGLERVTSVDVNTYLGITGEPIFTVNTTQIEEEILNTFPEFSEVSVSTFLPNTVAITVTERVPELVWNLNGEQMLIDQYGAHFSAGNDAYELSQYPIVYVDSSPDNVNLNLLPELTAGSDIRKFLPEEPGKNQDVNKKQQIVSPNMVSAIHTLYKYTPDGAELHFDTLHGLSWVDRRGWNVYFGDPEEIGMKLSVYRAILNKLKTDELKPEYISVEFVHNPYYRLAE